MIGAQAKDNKQMRVLVGDRNEEASRAIDEACKAAFEVYRNLIVRGVPRELARSVLPVATYSHMFATVDLLNLLKFIKLRDHDHAQHEIRVYAQAMRDLARRVAPVCMEVARG
jgi:thymidylate synthase (FAD)